jgi:Acetyltransferase (GNAT) domain
MTAFEIPMLTTDRLRLRAFRAGDLDAYAAMRANPEVVRHLGSGRTSTPVEVWRMMAAFLGQWALRGYGVWACEEVDGGAFIGAVGIFHPLDWAEPQIIYSLDRPFWRQGFATEAAGAARNWLFEHFPWPERRALFGPTISHRNASRGGSERFTRAHPSRVVPPMSTGCTTARGEFDPSALVRCRHARLCNSYQEASGGITAASPIDRDHRRRRSASAGGGRVSVTSGLSVSDRLT